MNEREWQTSQDPAAMARYLMPGTPTRYRTDEAGWRAPRRKLLLFTAAAIRTRQDLVEKGGIDVLLRRAEEFLEGGRSTEDIQQVHGAVQRLRQEGYDDCPSLHDSAAWQLEWLVHSSYPDTNNVDPLSSILRWPHVSPPALARLLRDTVGNPFDPAPFDPAWRTPQALTLAQAAYEERRADYTLDPFRLALAADALEEAGCVGEVLDGLRSPGPFYRGAWSLDLVLGR